MQTFSILVCQLGRRLLLQLTVAAVGIFKFSTFMLSFVRIQLSSGVKDILTTWSNAMYVIAGFGVATTAVGTGFVLHELFESIFAQHLVFLVVTFMFFHVRFVLERKIALRSPAMKVCGTLAVEGAGGGTAVLCRPKSLESFLDDGRIFAMEVSMHLDVRSTDVNLVTTSLNTMVVGLPPVVGTRAESLAAIVHWTVAHKAVLQGLLTFFVPFEMTHHLLFADKDFVRAIQAMVVIPVAKIFAVFSSTVCSIAISSNIVMKICRVQCFGCVVLSGHCGHTISQVFTMSYLAVLCLTVSYSGDRREA